MGNKQQAIAHQLRLCEPQHWAEEDGALASSSTGPEAHVEPTERRAAVSPRPPLSPVLVRRPRVGPRTSLAPRLLRARNGAKSRLLDHQRAQDGEAPPPPAHPPRHQSSRLLDVVPLVSAIVLPLRLPPSGLESAKLLIFLLWRVDSRERPRMRRCNRATTMAKVTCCYPGANMYL